MTEKDRIDTLIQGLIIENPEYRNLQVPTDIPDKRKLLRALMNVRPPNPISDDWLSLEDEELAIQREEKGVVDVSELPRKGRFILWQGDITRLKVDAIVNAANSQMLGCFVPLHGCIDNAIHSAAGVELRLECAEIMRRKGEPEPTGEAVITSAYNLPAGYVIHTVGPIVRTPLPTEKDRRLLSSCYRSCLECAEANDVKSIAFCCISTGEFHYPNEEAAEVAIDTVEEYFTAHPDSIIDTVVFNVFKDIDYEIYSRLLTNRQ